MAEKFSGHDWLIGLNPSIPQVENHQSYLKRPAFGMSCVSGPKISRLSGRPCSKKRSPAEQGRGPESQVWISAAKPEPLRSWTNTTRLSPKPPGSLLLPHSTILDTPSS